MAGLSEQAERFGALIAHDDAVTVQLKGHLEEATTLEDETCRAPAVIVATGSAHKELGLDAGRYLAALDDADSIATALGEETTTATADTAALPVFVIGAGPPVPRVSVCC